MTPRRLRLGSGMDGQLAVVVWVLWGVLGLGTASAIHGAVAGDPPADDPPAGFSHLIATTDTGGLETRSAALILSGQEGGEIPLAVVAASRGGGAAGVDLWASLAAEHLLANWPAEAEDLLVEVYAYILDERSAVVEYSSQAFRLGRENHGKALAGGEPLHVAAAWDLPPGTYSLRVLVLLRQSGKLAMRIKPLVVTATADRLEPLFLRPATGLLASAEAPGTLGVPGIFELKGTPWMPQEWPDLNVHDRLFVRGEDLPSMVEVVVQDTQGQELRRLSAAPRTRSSARDDARSSPLTEIVLEPTGLAPGQYLVSLASEGTAPDLAAATAEMENPRVAVRIGQRKSAASQPAVDDSSAAPRTPTRRRQLGGAYRAALEQLAAGEIEAAMQAVMALERSALGQGTAKEEGELMTAELSLANFLGQREAEALIPIMVLHEELYRRYRRQQMLLLSTHSRKLVARLIEMHHGGSPTPGAKRLSAEIFTSQAGFLLELGSALAARNALSAALADDDSLAPALYLQATMAEALGDYPKAVDYLRRLAEVDGSRAEGRLRLAVNLKRLGKRNDEAKDLLQQLVSRQENDWVTVVAYQEWATQLWNDGEQQEALRVLMEARERFPQAHRLIVQTASVLDRLGRPGEARKLLKTLDGTTASGEERATPRLRYSRWPLDEAIAVRRSLRQRQRQHLEVLGHALAVGDGGGRAP